MCCPHVPLTHGRNIVASTRISRPTRRKFAVRAGLSALTLLAGMLAVVAGPAAPASASPTTTVYVTNRLANTVSVIDTASNTVTATIAVGDGPFDVAANPAGTRAYS